MIFFFFQNKQKEFFKKNLILFTKHFRKKLFFFWKKVQFLFTTILKFPLSLESSSPFHVSKKKRETMISKYAK